MFASKVTIFAEIHMVMVLLHSVLGYFCPTPQKGKNRRTRGVFLGCEWLNFNGELSLTQKISRDVQKSAARPNPTAE
jgi:hypothetical protein